MLQTYAAVLRDGRLEWEGRPPDVPPDGVRVHVTLLDPSEAAPDGRAMAEVLERIAAAGGPEAFGFDIDEWERERRADRLLPGRDE